MQLCCSNPYHDYFVGHDWEKLMLHCLVIVQKNTFLLLVQNSSAPFVVGGEGVLLGPNSQNTFWMCPILDLYDN